MSERQKYAFYTILTKAMPIWFVFLLFLLGKGLSYTQAILLDSVSAAIAIILEVPSGIMADRFSRKKIMVYGELALIINYVILACTDKYIFCIIGAAISGIGNALVSGTSDAMIYDVFVCDKNEDEYKKYIGTVNKYGFICVAVMTFISGYIFEIWDKLPMIISIVFKIIGLFFLIIFNEKRPECVQNKKFISLKIEIKNQIAILKKYIFNKRLLWIVLLMLVLMEIVSNINYTSQTYLPELGLKVSYLGIVLCVFNIISSIGSGRASKHELHGVRWLTIYCIILFCLAIKNIYVVLAIMGISRFFNGYIWVVLNDEMNKQIDSEERATVLSFQNIVLEILPLFIDPLIALLYDFRGISFAYIIMGSVLCVLLVIGTIAKRTALTVTK